MNKQILNLFFVFLFSLFLGGCLFIPTTPESLNLKIDNWLVNNEFDKIDDALHSLNENDPAFKSISKRKKSISKKKQAYINSASERARKLQQSSKWQAALNTYDDALNNIENQPQLKKEREKFISTRNDQVTKLKIDILLKKSRALISYKKTYAKLKQLIPNDYNANVDINRYHKDTSLVVKELNLCGAKFNKEKKFTLSKECYSLSNQLIKTPGKTFIVTSLTKNLDLSNNKKQQHKLLEAYDSAYKKHEYYSAKKNLTILLKNNPEHVIANKKLQALDKKIDSWIQNKTNIGKELYSQKKINAALILWKNALQLEPNNNELIQLINRAEKVSQKMKTLETSK